MKGILLAGGTGSRLAPATLAVSKQLLPVYDKPMVYHPLTTLMLAGIREILLISTPRDLPAFRALLGDGSQLGLSLAYAEQAAPRGIAEALVIGRRFLDGGRSALVLGDNLFHGHGLPDLLRRAAARSFGATVFCTKVREPQHYGVLAFDADGRPAAIVEKPVDAPSDQAVTGLYFYDGRAPDIAASLAPSARGEVEITDLNRWYLERGALAVERLGRGFSWLDCGNCDSLLQASLYVQALEARQGQQVACPEEVAYRMGYIDRAQLMTLAARYRASAYGRYLAEVAEERDIVAAPQDDGAIAAAFGGRQG
jgi:glucose-1-phosphate thymidylyltransferase